MKLDECRQWVDEVKNNKHLPASYIVGVIDAATLFDIAIRELIDEFHREDCYDAGFEHGMMWVMDKLAIYE